MKKLLLIAMAGVLAGSALANDEEELAVERCWTPVQINLASPLGVLWSDRDVYGLRLNLIYGHSLDVAGLDLGLVGATRGSVYGLQANLFNYVDGAFRGVEFGPIANFSVKNAYGVRIAGILNWSLDDGAGFEMGLLNVGTAYTGVEFGFVNWNSSTVTGLALGFVNASQTDFKGCGLGFANFCKGNLRGCQLGCFNMISGHSEGLQLGLFNAAEDHNGVQIGLLNINGNGALPIMVLVNANFR